MRLIFCLTLAAVATGSWAADVYRSVAADGTVIYSDRPTSSDAQHIVVATGRPASLIQRPAAVPPTAAGAAQSQQESTELLSRDPTPAERAEQKAKNCATAQDRVDRYRASHRLFRTLPNGDREYLNDAEIDEARARAAADVENWCD